MQPILPSHIVRSLAGHDRGRLYHVLRMEGEYAFLADGKIRQMKNPKRKKVKHLAYAGQNVSPVTDREIRESLAAFKAGREFEYRGGR